MALSTALRKISALYFIDLTSYLPRYIHGRVAKAHVRPVSGHSSLTNNTHNNCAHKEKSSETERRRTHDTQTHNPQAFRIRLYPPRARRTSFRIIVVHLTEVEGAGLSRSILHPASSAIGIAYARRGSEAR